MVESVGVIDGASSGASTEREQEEEEGDHGMEGNFLLTYH